MPALAQAADTASQQDLSSLKALYKRPAEIPFPKENPYSPEKAALGKALFFDPRLSGAQNMNCASCHNPSFGWEVPVPKAVGSMNEPLGRQAPTVINTAFRHSFFWDGRAPTAEAQAEGPITAKAEMNLKMSEAVERLEKSADYRQWFAIAFPEKGLTEETILAAIATYERTIVSGTSAFDEWVEGNEGAISETAKRGFELFNTKGRCNECHSGWNFTDEKFHDIGLDTDDKGRGALEPNTVEAQHAFKTPGLRDIAARAPYMHNGSLATLHDVMIHYVSGGAERPSRSAQMKPLDLTAGEIEAIVEFMKTLSAKTEVVSLPVLPN